MIKMHSKNDAASGALRCHHAFESAVPALEPDESMRMQLSFLCRQLSMSWSENCENCQRSHLAASEHDVVHHIQLKKVLGLPQPLSFSNDGCHTRAALHMSMVKGIQHRIGWLDLHSTRPCLRLLCTSGQQVDLPHQRMSELLLLPESAAHCHGMYECAASLGLQLQDLADFVASMSAFTCNLHSSILRR